jgi:hypothetical protein
MNQNRPDSHSRRRFCFRRSVVSGALSATLIAPQY